MLSPYPWQERQWRQLLSVLEQGRIPHALLLAGSEGLGLEDFARALAARLLCTEASGEQEACGTCRSCRLFAAGSHPDTVCIEPEEAGKAIKVEAVRALIDLLQLSSQYGRYKVAVITPAEAMNRNAANSLLKTLEEPTPGSVLILCARQPAQLPITIRSRCQRLNFSIAGDAATHAWLAERVGGAERAGELLTLSGGRPLAALELEQDASLEKQQALLDDLAALGKTGGDPAGTAQRWSADDIIRVMQWLLVFIRTMTRAKLAQTDAATGADRLQQRLKDLAQGVDLLQLLEWYAIVLRNYRAATGPYNLNKQGLLEEIIVYWQSLVQPQRR